MLGYSGCESVRTVTSYVGRALASLRFHYIGPPKVFLVGQPAGPSHIAIPMFRDQFLNLRPILLVAKTLVANVSDHFRDQFIIETILVTNLENNYNFFKLFWLPITSSL